MNPLRTLHDAVTLPFTALFVIGICWTVNALTSPGHWWVQWVMLGMGIAVVCAWGRALKLLVVGGGLAVAVAWASKYLSGRDGAQSTRAGPPAPPQG